MRSRPALTNLVPYEPGLSTDLVTRRFGLDEVVKPASNEFPLPPFPEVKRVIVDAIDELQRHPDGASTDLRAALAEHYSVSPEQVAAGNGTCESIPPLGTMFLDKLASLEVGGAETGEGRPS